MKKFLLILSILFSSFGLLAQSELKSVINKIDMSGSKSSIMALDKKIDAIVAKHPDKWLPLYWSGFTKLLISHKSATLTEKDTWIAKAEWVENKEWSKITKACELALGKQAQGSC